MIFSSLSKRERVILYLVAVFLSTALVYNFALVPLIKKWSDMDKEIFAKKIKLGKYIKLISGMRYYSDEYSRYAPQAGAEKSDEEQISSVLSFVETAAVKNNVYITSLKPGPAKSEKFYKNFLVEAQIEAGINDLAGFLYEIENSSRLLRVKSLDINARQGQDNSVKGRVLISNISL